MLTRYNCNKEEGEEESELRWPTLLGKPGLFLISHGGTFGCRDNYLVQHQSEVLHQTLFIRMQHLHLEVVYIHIVLPFPHPVLEENLGQAFHFLIIHLHSIHFHADFHDVFQILLLELSILWIIKVNKSNKVQKVFKKFNISSAKQVWLRRHIK